MTKQRYKMTFKCSEPECLSVFEKVTTNQNLMNPRCPYCKERKQANKLHRVGDGPVSEGDLFKRPFEKAPNIVYQCTDCENKIRLYLEPEQKLEKCPNCDSDKIKYVCNIDRSMSQSSKIQNKAIDETANIVMEDYKMGNLPDKKMQPGETMAPRLDPVRQNMAESMFGKKKGFASCLDMGTGRVRPIGNRGMNMGALARNAMAGAYAHGGVDPVAAAQSKREPMKINVINKTSN